MTSIGNSAFFQCIALDLNSLSLPDALLDIGDCAFQCCSSLRSVTIPNNVTNIGTSAFSDCGLLQSITIPDSVTRIGLLAFSNCGTDARCTQSPFDTTTIQDVQLADGWAVGYTDALVGERDLTGVRGIANGAFRDCVNLTGVTVPGTVPVIPCDAFQECIGLVRATISDGVKDIESEAFYDCRMLADAKIPNSVTNIGAYAFMRTALTHVWIPDSVEGLGGAAFFDCPNMTLATIGNGVKDDSWNDPFGGTTLADVYVSDIYRGHDFGLPVGLALSPSSARPISVSTEIGAVCSIPGAVLRYTTDGTAPTASSPLFEPIVATTETTVRVGAFVNGELALTTRGDYRLFVSAGAKGTVSKHGDCYAVTANGGMLSESDLSFALSRDAYSIAISPDGMMASVRLKRPEFDVGNSGFHDSDDHDATGLIVHIDPNDLATRPEGASTAFLRGLPVKTYPGFFYRAPVGRDARLPRQGRQGAGHRRHPLPRRRPSDRRHRLLRRRGQRGVGFSPRLGGGANPKTARK